MHRGRRKVGWQRVSTETKREAAEMETERITIGVSGVTQHLDGASVTLEMSGRVGLESRETEEQQKEHRKRWCSTGPMLCGVLTPCHSH
jgi:hypothetical protein